MALQEDPQDFHCFCPTFCDPAPWDMARNPKVQHSPWPSLAIPGPSGGNAVHVSSLDGYGSSCKKQLVMRKTWG